MAELQLRLQTDLLGEEAAVVLRGGWGGAEEVPHDYDDYDNKGPHHDPGGPLLQKVCLELTRSLLSWFAERSSSPSSSSSSSSCCRPPSSGLQHQRLLTSSSLLGSQRRRLLESSLVHYFLPHIISRLGLRPPPHGDPVAAAAAGGGGGGVGGSSCLEFLRRVLPLGPEGRRVVVEGGGGEKGRSRRPGGGGDCGGAGGGAPPPPPAAAGGGEGDCGGFEVYHSRPTSSSADSKEKAAPLSAWLAGVQDRVAAIVARKRSVPLRGAAAATAAASAAAAAAVVAREASVVILYSDAAVSLLPIETMPCLAKTVVCRGLHPALMRANFRSNRDNDDDAAAAAARQGRRRRSEQKKKTKKCGATAGSRNNGSGGADDEVVAAAAVSPSSSSSSPPWGCRSLDARHGRVFYVVNPEGDLLTAEKAVPTHLRNRPTWTGVVGTKPPNLSSQILHHFLHSDIYLYCGHNAGELYLNDEAVQRGSLKGARDESLHSANNRRSAAVLIGCSSGKVCCRGGFDSCVEGPAVDYLVGGCPFVVGVMWNVTDVDLDRFTWRLLDVWSEEAKPSAAAPRAEAATAAANEACGATEVVVATDISVGKGKGGRGGKKAPRSISNSSVGGSGRVPSSRRNRSSDSTSVVDPPSTASAAEAAPPRRRPPSRSAKSKYAPADLPPPPTHCSSRRQQVGVPKMATGPSSSLATLAPYLAAENTALGAERTTVSRRKKRSSSCGVLPAAAVVMGSSEGTANTTSKRSDGPPLCSSSSSCPSKVRLCEAVLTARRACILEHIIGGSCAVFGLPM
eukprot:GHVU01108508.1.p1 GENE.GHVU01108508.1~~GHVU01108508.1.p1  ORF type:complete len:810 (+),score=168.07 GHVU01108508.1:49-2430(+)